MRVFAIAEIWHFFEIHEEVWREAAGLPDSGEMLCNLRIVSRGSEKCFAREIEQNVSGQNAFTFNKPVRNPFVVVRRGHDGNVLEIFRWSTNHRGSADIDVLNDFLKGDIRLSCGFDKGIQVHAHKID